MGRAGLRSIDWLEQRQNRPRIRKRTKQRIQLPLEALFRISGTPFAANVDEAQKQVQRARLYVVKGTDAETPSAS